jgi:DNA helicase IV
VVVDEAQDLSAMELRMVARRSPDRSMTVLGDLAQATGVGGSTSWDDAITELGHGRVDGRGRERDTVGGRVAELELGYRVPAVLIEFANRLLPVAAPGVRPSRSVREGGDAPLVVRVSMADGLGAEVAEHARRLAAEWGVVGVLAPPSLLDAVVDALTDAGVEHRDARVAVSIDDGITVVAAELAKGLEFDAIVVVEPIAITEDHEDAGYRVLYVALTRATQRVTIVHARALPEALTGGPTGATSAPGAGELTRVDAG